MEPVSDRAERSLLGAILRHPDALDDVTPLVTPEMFRQWWCGRVFQAMLDLHGVKPIDLVSLADLLHQRHELDKIGHGDTSGYSALADLWDAEPTGAHAVYYAETVRDAHLRCSLAFLAAELVREAESPTMSAQEALEAAEKRLWALSELGAEGKVVPLAAEVNNALDRIDRRKEEPGGLTTGFPDLDDILAGFQAGELVTLAARPSLGKTALSVCMARNIALGEGVPVFFVSLEQSGVELATRLLCAEAGVDSQRLRRGYHSPADLEALGRAAGVLRPLPVHLDQTPGQSVQRIAANARRLRRRHGIGAVFIDYLQLIEAEDRKQDRHLQVGTMTRRLKCLARELNIPVVALAQLNRAAEDQRGPPRLSQLRESGSVEQDSDTVLFLYRPEQQPAEVQAIDCIVAKQRNGPTGTATLGFRRSCTRFENYQSGGVEF